MIEREGHAILSSVDKEALYNRLPLSRNLEAVREQTVQISERMFQAERRARHRGPGAGSHLVSEPMLVWLE